MDPCYVVGILEMSKAYHVMTMSDCSRWCGANKAIKMVELIVIMLPSWEFHSLQWTILERIDKNERKNHDVHDETDTIRPITMSMMQMTTAQQEAQLEPKAATRGMDSIKDNEATLHQINGSYHVLYMAI
jgi:hypothetical protein